jgi:hypothetical protein
MYLGQGYLDLILDDDDEWAPPRALRLTIASTVLAISELDLGFVEESQLPEVFACVVPLLGGEYDATIKQGNMPLYAQGKPNAFVSTPPDHLHPAKGQLAWMVAPTFALYTSPPDY